MTTQTLEVEVSGLRFTVDVAGPPSGAPVLLLHGFPETRHMWRHQLQALGEEGFRAIAPDQRGYSPGARPATVDGYRTELLVADAFGLMGKLGADRFHLVGHDWGGQIAWLMGTARPERIRSLGIFSRPHPAAFARAMQEDAAQTERSRHHRTFRADDAVTRVREAKLEPLRVALANQGVAAADAAIYIDALLQPGAIEGAMNWYRAGGIAAAATPPVRLPTLYVWGRDDATVGRRAAELTEQFVKAPYLFVELEGAGHFLVDQFPERISELLLNHLKGVD